ncbi:alpha-amylase family protein [Meiothermus sp.]|uniref:alpha-amylase family protein n=1 Tax=Meiothermus sp. TaxID=1955249 RepID=UPI0021DDC179|nr:alpha-amylase family protein [Meiothermus sp.]GIW26054.1 MAG: alpha-amylase [Meiothermus sp.]
MDDQLFFRGLASQIEALDKYRSADLQARIQRYLPELLEGLQAVYPEAPLVAERVARVIGKNLAERPPDLQALDLLRIHTPDWFQKPHMHGYIAYTERFAENLRGVAERIPYLKELGIRYLHLMPLLLPREGENDGGYAVADYRRVRPDLGTMDDLEALCARLRQEGLSLCLDLVLNHVAREHPWALAARQGDPHYRAYFYIYPDRTIPDAFERTLPEVFPDFAPGNFTWDDELGGWVWTTFNRWQWDVNWGNPEVFLEYLDLILWLANKGVEVFRLDAIAFTWKRLGTHCQNQPEVHALTQAMRAAVRIGAPAVAFKAEAIVAPEDLIAYLGTGRHYGKVSELAYHNTLMVQIWSSLASRDTRLFTQALQRFPQKPPTTAWATYLRCHDDIGWAISDTDAAAVGLDGAAHRRFLADFYQGDFPGSFARGMPFQENPLTGDRRTSGSAASLAGLEAALESGNPRLVHLAIERLLLAHAVFIGYGEGIPLIYMGDELGLLNDYNYTEEPAHKGDNRWLHRPRMDWAKAERRHQEGTVEHRLFHGIKGLLEARARIPQLHAAFPTRPLWQPNPHLLVLRRAHPEGTLVQVYNFSEQDQALPWETLQAEGIVQPFDQITLAPAPAYLWPYARLWLTQHRL